MRDFIDLLKMLKTERPELENRATILNGGSYGGMLSAWMRMKYPNQFQGALAASAPILWF
jgi:lysosomal Pro-X carboxypeptidase